MPTYDRKCELCGHSGECVEPMQTPDPKFCPTCKQKTFKRQISVPVGIHFKGSGFYATDYCKPKGGEK